MPRNPTLSTLPSRTTQRLLIVLLALFMWLQFAGTLHKLVHAHHSEGAASTSQAVEYLFPQHSKENALDCQLLDLQCSGVALSQAFPVLALPVFLLEAARYKTAVFNVRTRLAYLARAPPTLI